ncbi:uncharacterized protein PHALS_05185 [Plasmopara halstedii]|uniref:Uncharacterized protein n=1 Tax=Plasmopara halstedii TaxID=4781 RepID=A0A0P1B1K7_PLAHL|nr:uncharacterized protein PHALS_05185 [Plasmopara halstedii]CEG47856.1 hypothetical protein PHALS_05185 [Plasmopara halstedii]|eukprot:XP_024584225.1 hypothetical protein PHALS_05185 [Plasmopara halstedii]
MHLRFTTPDTGCGAMLDDQLPSSCWLWWHTVLYDQRNPTDWLEASQLDQNCIAPEGRRSLRHRRCLRRQ